MIIKKTPSFHSPPFTLLAIFKQDRVSARWRKRLQTSRFVNGAIRDFYMFDWITRPPTYCSTKPTRRAQLPAPHTLGHMQHRFSTMAAEELWPYCISTASIQHVVPIRQIIQKSEVNLLWFNGFLLSLGSRGFLDSSQKISSVKLLYGGPARSLTNVKSMC